MCEQFANWFVLYYILHRERQNNVRRKYSEIGDSAEAEHSPRVEIVVTLIDVLRHFLDARGVVLLINRYELLRELIKEFNLELVLVQIDVERLEQK